MKTQIKTIYIRMESHKLFDKEVNESLRKEWKLGRIETLKAETESKKSMLFALLYKQE